MQQSWSLAIRTVILGVLSGVVCLLSTGCREAPTDQDAAYAASGLSGPTFDFFDGRHPLPPSEWAGVKVPNGEDRAQLIPALHIQEVNALSRKAYNLGVLLTSTDAEFDPTGFYVADLWRLLELGDSRALKLKWIPSYYGPAYRDDIEMLGGVTVGGLELAIYLLNMRVIAEEGALDDMQMEHDLAEKLLWIGWHIYRSESHVGSWSSRIFALTGAWGAAFQLRGRQAEASGDEVLAREWADRRTQLEDVSRAMSAASREAVSKLAD